MAQQKSWKGKKQYGNYKTENRVLKNKIKKLTRHCKEFPDDEVGKENLERIKKKGYTPRSKPLIPGSNPTIEKVRLSSKISYLFGPKTAGEQLSKLLGIPEPKYRRRAKAGKTPITIKKKKSVKRS